MYGKIILTSYLPVGLSEEMRHEWTNQLCIDHEEGDNYIRAESVIEEPRSEYETFDSSSRSTFAMWVKG